MRQYKKFLQLPHKTERKHLGGDNKYVHGDRFPNLQAEKVCPKSSKRMNRKRHSHKKITKTVVRGQIRDLQDITVETAASTMMAIYELRREVRGVARKDLNINNVSSCVNAEATRTIQQDLTRMRENFSRISIKYSVSSLHNNTWRQSFYRLLYRGLSES